MTKNDAYTVAHVTCGS